MIVIVKIGIGLSSCNRSLCRSFGFGYRGGTNVSGNDSKIPVTDRTSNSTMNDVFQYYYYSVHQNQHHIQSVMRGREQEGVEDDDDDDDGERMWQSPCHELRMCSAP